MNLKEKNVTPQEDRTSKEEIFDRLVENALDFLFRAVKEIENLPKYSAIHFCAAVELLIKARLMKEHWSLVIGKTQEPDWEKFISGDFQSVSLDDAASRLEKIVRSGLSKTELDAFKIVVKHRNKMMHFFHENYSEEGDNKYRRNIVKEQLKAWYFLNRILTNKWEIEFSRWSEKISEINDSLRQLREFLQIVFDDLQPEIEESKNKGGVFGKCPSCGFNAQKCDDIERVLYDSTCLVCRLNEKKLNIRCPECEEMVTFKQEGFATCQSCDRSLEPEDVAEAIIDANATHIAIKEGDNSRDFGNCSECDTCQVVVLTENDDQWICASCFQVFELPLQRCGWCNGFNTGDMEMSFLVGCNCCSGSNVWNKDD